MCCQEKNGNTLWPFKWQASLSHLQKGRDTKKHTIINAPKIGIDPLPWRVSFQLKTKFDENSPQKLDLLSLL